MDAQECRVNTRFTPTSVRKPSVGANLVFARIPNSILFPGFETASLCSPEKGTNTIRTVAVDFLSILGLEN
jgi:hypothetical protein